MRIRTFRSVGAGALASALVLSMTLVAPASASVDVAQSMISAKTITCYKGTQVKKVTTAKCPKGWSTKKPATTASKKVVLNLNFSGTGQLLWSSSDVKASGISGKGGSSTLGLTTLTATGEASPQSQCTPIRGSGQISGTGGSISFKVDAASQACGEAESVPTLVNLYKATVTVTGGTGKYAGATGSLKVTGSFRVTTTTAGAKESPSFTSNFSGTITTK